MTTRTLPSAFPSWSRESFASLQAARAPRLRMLAQACNWLWANMVRFFGYSAYEGNGFYIRDNSTHPAQGDLDHLPPTGSTTARLLVCFLAPPNWGPSGRVQIKGRSTLTNPSGSADGLIIAGVYDLDGNYVGSTSSVTYSATGTNDWTLTISVPQDKAYQVKVWSDPTLSNDLAPSPSYDHDYVMCMSARYLEATADDLPSADTPPTAWLPTAHDYIDETGPVVMQAYSAMLLQRISDNLMHLYTQRPPMILTTHLGPHFYNDSTFFEVGRYVVRLTPQVDTIDGRLVVWCTHGGAGNEVRVLVDGVVKETFTALATGLTTLSLANITGLTGGTDITITIEAKSTAAGADWGTVVLGVDMWEQSADLDLPSGTTVPGSYAPVDEEALVAYKTIAQEPVNAIIRNVTWLAANRLKTLVQDWRHRTYKRIGLSGGEMLPQGDWTRGGTSGGSPDYVATTLKNITVFPQATVADGDGSTSFANKDGLGYYPYGESAGGWTTSSSWPPAADHQQQGHGDRLRQVFESLGGYNDFSEYTGRQIQGWVRARRCRPNVVTAFDLGSGGPGPEEPGFVGRGTIDAYVGSTRHMRWAITGRGPSAMGIPPDAVAQWYGPEFMSRDDFGTLDLRGLLLSNQVTPNSSLQGLLFEMELCGSIFVDVPLDAHQLAQL